MNRRGFLATLLAPLLPKPKPKQDYLLWFFSQAPRFQFGWTGYKTSLTTTDLQDAYAAAMTGTDHPNTIIAGSNLVILTPRTGFKLIGKEF